MPDTITVPGILFEFIIALELIRMAKKSSKSRRQGAKNSTVFAPSSAAPAEKTQPAAGAPAPAKKTVDFVTEYFYVYQDLRNVLLVSALMFAVLVGLSFAI